QGSLNEEALSQALEDVVERHEVLRTVFEEEEGVPWQKILPAEQARLPLVTEAISEEQLEQRLREATSVGIKLEQELPLKVPLFRLTDQTGQETDTHVLLLVLHHIAGDGWSMQPLARDLEQAYRARLDGRAPQFEPLPVQYADYTLWQRQLLGKAEAKTEA